MTQYTLSYMIMFFFKTICKFGIYIYDNIFCNYDKDEIENVLNYTGIIFGTLGTILILFGNIVDQLLAPLFLFISITSLTFYKSKLINEK